MRLLLPVSWEFGFKNEDLKYNSSLIVLKIIQEEDIYNYIHSITILW